MAHTFHEYTNPIEGHGNDGNIYNVRAAAAHHNDVELVREYHTDIERKAIPSSAFDSFILTIIEMSSDMNYNKWFFKVKYWTNTIFEIMIFLGFIAFIIALTEEKK